MCPEGRVSSFNSSPSGQDGRHFADDNLQMHFRERKFCILVKISLKFIRKGPIDNKRALV